MVAEHVGATALPTGRTKGDVDVALRPSADEFPAVVAVLTKHLQVAQPGNWTSTFASFSDPTAPLPLGVQVSIRGSEDDFLVTLRDRMAKDDRLRSEYNRCKETAASGTREDYWQAKNKFLQSVLDDLRG
jgi:GrpB-like predicted nucleotidyltransferase (UPF0157 family)